MLNRVRIAVGYRVSKGCGFRNLAFRVGHGCGCVIHRAFRREAREHCLGNLYAFGFTVIVGHRDIERHKRAVYHVALILRYRRDADGFDLAFFPRSLQFQVVSISKPNIIVCLCCAQYFPSVISIHQKDVLNKSKTLFRRCSIVGRDRLSILCGEFRLSFNRTAVEVVC